MRTSGSAAEMVEHAKIIAARLEIFNIPLLPFAVQKVPIELSRGYQAYSEARLQNTPAFCS